MLAVIAGLVVFVSGEALGLSRAGNFVFAIGIIVANVPEGLLPTHALDGNGIAARGLATQAPN